MSLLVTGSIGIDSVTTPYGVREDCLGGSCIYFSMAASFFAPVRLLGAIGSDCPFDLAKVFAGRNVDLKGVQLREHSKTFRWKGTYEGTMNDRRTDYLELNVLAEEPPPLPPEYKDSKFVFLANTAPNLQLQSLRQIDAPIFVAADTMDCWIVGKLEELKLLLGEIHCLIINDEEARLLAVERNLVKAAEIILAMGPRVLIIKRGEAGSLMCSATGERFVLPAYPALHVIDPTGAGDVFAGAFMGYLSSVGGATSFESLKTAIAYGTVAASFAISDFSLGGLTQISRTDIDNRLEALRKITHI